MDDSEQANAEIPGAGRKWFCSTDLALFFLRLGTTAFGGPAAHIAIMEDELVRRRKWLSREKFLDLLGASSLIPGPVRANSQSTSDICAEDGRDLPVGGICFILPAAILVAFIAWAYVRFGHLPAVAGVLYGVKPVVIAVILQALWGLGPHGDQELAPCCCRRHLRCAQFFRDERTRDSFWSRGNPRLFSCLFPEGLRNSRWRGPAFLASLWKSLRTNLPRWFPLAGAGGAVSLVPGLWPLFLVLPAE